MQEDIKAPCIVEGELSECKCFAVVEPGEMAKVGSKKTTESVFVIGYEAEVYKEEPTIIGKVSKFVSVHGDITMWGLMIIILSAALLVVSNRSHAASDIDVLRKNMETQKNEALSYSNQINKRAVMNSKNITELQIKKVDKTVYDAGQARQDKALAAETVARIEGDKRNDKALAGKVDNATYEGDKVSISTAINGAVAAASDKVSREVYNDAMTRQVGVNESLAGGMSDANTRIDSTNSAISDVAASGNRRFSQLKTEVDKNKRRADAGIAGVAAMASIPSLVSGQHFNVGAGIGVRGGQQALAVGVSASVTDRTTVKLSVAADTEHSFTAGAGVAYGW